MYYILTYERVVLATSDIQSILEIPATDEIPAHGGSKPWSCLNLAEQWHIQHATQSTDLRVNRYINPVVPERSKEE